MDATAFFDGWAPLARTLSVGALSYASLVAILRLSGKRTLAKMNAFDLVVTVALGSILATMLLARDVSLVRGVLGCALLVALQAAITWSSIRVRWFARLVKSEPRLVFLRGTFLRAAMRRERVTEGEVRAAVRAAGIEPLAEVEAVVLEADGTFSVVRRPTEPVAAERSSLAGVIARGDRDGSQGER